MNEEQVYAELGRRISVIRKWRGLSQETLARRMGMVRASITNTEAGRQKLPIWNLLQVSEILEVPPHIWLLMPDEWAAWCRSNNVTIKRVTVQDKPFTRTYKRVERIAEQVEAA